MLDPFEVMERFGIAQERVTDGEILGGIMASGVKDGWLLHKATDHRWVNIEIDGVLTYQGPPNENFEQFVKNIAEGIYGPV